MTGARGRRLALAAVALVALVLVARALGGAAPPPSGPASSSYATQPAGAAALEELLRRSGHATRRLRASLADEPPRAGWTVVLLDPGALGPGEEGALRRAVRAGTRVVVAGRGAPGIAGALGTRVLPGPTLPRAPLRPAADAPEVAGIRAVDPGPGRTPTWIDAPTGTRAVLRAGARPVALAARPGPGGLVVLASAQPLHNAQLAAADNAQLALDLVGTPSREVAFVESVHGYAPATGFAALPADWRLALGLLGVAALAFVLSRLRRLGRPEEDERPLGPPRAAYVEALAGALARTRDGDRVAARVVGDAARAQLTRRGGPPADAPAAALAAHARRVGLPDDEADALGAPERSDLLAVGRAHAHLHRTATPSSARPDPKEPATP